jgi:hypothetical protein
MDCSGRYLRPRNPLRPTGLLRFAQFGFHNGGKRRCPVLTSAMRNKTRDPKNAAAHEGREKNREAGKVPVQSRVFFSFFDFMVIFFSRHAAFMA